MAKFCTECGSELRNGIAFCTHCGAKAEQDAPAFQGLPETDPAPGPAPRRTVSPAAQHTPVARPTAASGSKKAVSTGTFFCLMFLFSLPVLGWLICLIVAFAAKNPNIRNFARAMLIWLVIALVISAILGLAINSFLRSFIPYLQETMDGLEKIGNSGDLGALTEQFGQFASLEDLLGELESRIPAE